MTLDVNSYKNSRDPYNDRLRPVDRACPHGNGSNCVCQEPEYEGLFVAPIHFKHDDKTRHAVVTMQLCHDGGMVEYHDPVTRVVVGCVGRHHVSLVTPFEEYLAAWRSRG